jgi:ABC-type nitrate/sulfonate/bicarbonate transport system ATPase subunit
MRMEPKLVVRAVSKEFRRRKFAPVQALAGVDIEVGRRKFVSIVGPSGCGKSTLFNIIAGIEAPTAGSVHIDGVNVTGKTGHVSYMFQKDLLLPWRNVLDNVILGQELLHVDRVKARLAAAPLAERYGLKGFENHFPSVLSGGMRQRAALLRTLLFDREILLLDEPFGALDALTRAAMQELLLKIFDEVDRTIVFITHDVEEAVYLSDVIYVLTPRPTRVQLRVEVPLPRPRDMSMLADARCIEMRADLLRTLRDTSAAPHI